MASTSPFWETKECRARVNPQFVTSSRHRLRAWSFGVGAYGGGTERREQRNFSQGIGVYVQWTYMYKQHK